MVLLRSSNGGTKNVEGKSMETIRNLSVRTKLIILAIVPIIGLTFFSVNQFKHSLSVMQNAELVEKLVLIAAVNNRVVHELQKERGASAGYLATQGIQFGDVLREQINNTDKAVAERRNVLDEIDIQTLPLSVRTTGRDFDNRIDQLEEIREQVRTIKVSASSVVNYYSSTNQILLNYASSVAEESSNAKVVGQIQAYYNFLQGKELSGIERAVLNGVFSNDKFDSESYKKLIEIISKQNSFFATFEVFASDNQINLYQDAMRNEDSRRVTELQSYRVKEYCIRES